MNFMILSSYSNHPMENLNSPAFLVDFIISSLIILFITIFIAYKINRPTVWAYYGICDIIFIVAFLFGIDMLCIVTALFITAGSIVFCFINSGFLRKYIAIPLKNTKTKYKVAESKAYDKEKFITDVCAAVRWLSRNKVGALITIEKKTPLDDFIKNGTVLNAPFVPELVETIFYDKTRLHDGAIVVKNGVIIAAAVMYDNSTDEYEGKLGARHRAAIGISKITDSVTVVVSEETGRISIAHTGILDNVKSDEFESVLRNQIAA